MSGYGDSRDWRSVQWAMSERSAQDLFNLWFRREEYVRKYYPELLNG